MDSLSLKLCDIQGRLFEKFLTTSYDANSLIKTFMNCYISRNLDSSYNYFQWAGEEYLLDELTDNFSNTLLKKDKDYFKEALFWMGYTYRYWHYYTNQSSKEIYKIAPFKIMYENYYIFHTMSCEQAIDNLIEIYNQNKNKSSKN